MWLHALNVQAKRIINIIYANNRKLLSDINYIVMLNAFTNTKHKALKLTIKLKYMDTVSVMCLTVY